VTFKIDGIAVGHTERDETGTKIEPEAQQAVQVGSMPVHVNLGVADHERVNGGRPTITKANAGTLAHAGQVKRTTSAGMAAKEAVVMCANCRFFDVEAVQSKARNPHVADSHIAVSATLIKLGRTLPDAQMEARTVGMCRQADCLAMPYASCNLFRQHPAMKRVLAWARDRILRAAQGR
jgi:hypothetical protein